MSNLRLSERENRASDRASSISDTSRCENGKRSEVKVFKTGPGLVWHLYSAGLASRCQDLPRHVSVTSLPIILSCLRGKLEVSLFLFGEPRKKKKKCVFPLMWWKKPNRWLITSSTSLLIPQLQIRRSCFPAQLPQTVMHDGLMWLHSWLTVEHLAALPRFVNSCSIHCAADDAFQSPPE